MANQNVYPGYGNMTANGGWNPGSASDWQNFSQVYPAYQQQMWSNNASANAAMNRIGGMGASSGTPYSSALGQLAMQGASGLQSLFSHGGGGGGSYGPSQPAQPTHDAGTNPNWGDPNYSNWKEATQGPWNDPNSQFYGDKSGYVNWQAANDKNSLASLGLSTGTANMNTGLLGRQGAAIGSGYDLTTGQNQQALQGLAGSGAVGAAGNRNALAGMNQQYYGGTGPLANYGQGGYNPYASSRYLGYGAQPTYNRPTYTGPGQIGTH